MKHRVVGRRLDRTTEHRTAMFRNMVTSLLRHERIITTTPKAKELKRIAEKIITLAKKGSHHARRIAHRDVRDVEVLQKLFGLLAERFKTRPGGYTRLVRVGRRPGDNAEVSVIELLDRAPPKEVDEKKPEEKKAEKKPEKKPRASKAESAEKKPAEKKSVKKKPAKKTKTSP